MRAVSSVYSGQVKFLQPSRHNNKHLDMVHLDMTSVAQENLLKCQCSSERTGRASCVGPLSLSSNKSQE